MKIKNLIVATIVSGMLLFSSIAPAVSLLVANPYYRGKNLVCPTGYTFFSYYKGNNMTGYRTYYNKCLKIVR